MTRIKFFAITILAGRDYPLKSNALRKEESMYIKTWTLSDGRIYLEIGRKGRHVFIGTKGEIMRQARNLLTKTEIFRLNLLF